MKHLGEEPMISGHRGSGTIFMSNCNMHCLYCQNYTISQLGYGREYTVEQVASMMLDLQAAGVHNINFVTPTHFTLQIREAIIKAKQAGLSIPIVWNSNAYEHANLIRELEGLIDIFLPDFRYADCDAALKYSDAPDYPTFAQKALSEMHRQVGKIELDADGIAQSGLLIRILLLPRDLNNIRGILTWIADNLGTETYISLMTQYYPTYKANEYSKISRPIHASEYREAVSLAEDIGFENGYFQGLGITPEWTPDFKK
jgi:putative pyruvate formate lyase activating enzyme